jgi:hypothetical protein
MKKITTYFFVFLLLTATVMANPFGTRQSADARHGNPNTVLSVPFYSEDFASGLPGTWLNIDNGSAANVLWRWTDSGAANGFPFDDAMDTAGTSAENGYMIFDSDSAGGGGGEDASLITDAIDCSGKANVHLMFNEYFAQYNVSMGIVSVSTDGTTWTDVHHAEAGLGADQTTPNPFSQDIDISSVAAGQATVFIQFRWIGDFEYFWMVDDVALYEVAASDGGVINITSPIGSCALLTNAETVTVEIKNFASSDMSDFLVSYVADGGTAVTDTITDTISSGGTLMHSFTIPADLSAAGTHNILAYTTVLNDADNANDQFSMNLFSGPHIVDQANAYTQGFEAAEDQSGWLAVDADADSNTWGLSTIIPHTGSVCATYTHDLPTNQANDYYFSTCLGLADSNVYQLEFYYRNFSPFYQANMEVILCTAQDPATMVATLVPSMLVNTSLWTLSSSNIYVPTGASGTYYIGWHVTQQDSSTSLKIDDINLFYTGPNSVSLTGNTSLSVYPNPGSGLIHINGVKELTEITVYDMVGKAVFTNTVAAGNQTVDLRNQPKGVYSMVLRSEKSSVTKQLIITGN